MASRGSSLPPEHHPRPGRLCLHPPASVLPWVVRQPCGSVLPPVRAHVHAPLCLHRLLLCTPLGLAGPCGPLGGPPALGTPRVDPAEPTATSPKSWFRPNWTLELPCSPPLTSYPQQSLCAPLAPEIPLQAASWPPRSCRRGSSLFLLGCLPGPRPALTRLGHGCPRRGRACAPRCEHGRLRQPPAFCLRGRGGAARGAILPGGTVIAAASRRGARPGTAGHAPRTPEPAPDPRAPDTGCRCRQALVSGPAGLWAWAPGSH